jgi:hypothetical protein
MTCAVRLWSCSEQELGVEAGALACMCVVKQP